MTKRIPSSPVAAVAVVLAGVWFAAVGGCASLSVSKVTEVFEKEEPVVSPNSLAVVWTTTVIEKPGAVATRGFGGVVTFYGADRNTPVRVDGELTIYAYDELTHQNDNSTPDRKYVFTPEQLAKHYGKGPVGPAYHIWIPWDEMGRPRQEVGLILRFDAAEGKAVLSKPTHAVLPGPTDDRDRLSVSRQIDLTPMVHGRPTTPIGQTQAGTGGASGTLAGTGGVSGTLAGPEASQVTAAGALGVQVTTLNLPSRGMPRAESTAPQPNAATAVPSQTEPRPPQAEPRP